MKKIYFLAIVAFSTILLILFVFYNRYRGVFEDEKVDAYISKNIDILNDNLNFEKQYALSLSLFISKNQTIKKALHVNNQKMALAEIDKFLKDIKNSTGIDNIDIQVHTKDLRAFARNWDKSDYLGLELSGFRKGLVEVKKTKKSLVSIELGKRLNIKAISPILDEKQNFIGSIEIIMDFKNVEKRLKKFNLKMLPLLDKKFINIAVYLKNNQKIDRYFITEKEYSKELYQKLKNNMYIFKKDKFYYEIDGKIVVFVPMLSVGIQDVGFIVLCMDAKQNEAYTYPRVDIEHENSSYEFNQKRRKVVIK
ncbi:cache domain-containing protein [Sulfurospirillum sp. 1307]|jgi:hypothetical protein